ncbi:MAG: sugar nucleotide-binding protein [Candidatus Zixiibacteriota bacterium]
MLPLDSRWCQSVGQESRAPDTCIYEVSRASDPRTVGSHPPAQARPDRTQTGVIHIGGAEYLSRYDFAVRVAERFGFDKTNIYPTKTHILKQEAKRLLHGGLKVEKAQSLLKTKLLNVEEGLKRAKENQKQTESK